MPLVHTAVGVQYSIYVYCGVYLILGIVLGSITHWLTSKYVPQLPFTVCVFFIGSIIGDLNSLGGDLFIKNSLFESNVILYLLLPILIFGETMNLNWHHVLSGIVQSTWLAGPGAVIGTTLMAIAARFIFPEWSWTTSFMFGAILSATDPVAVVSLLKTSGASHQLTLLIVGESLLNDGSAMVLFTLFFNILQGGSVTFGYVVIFFIETAICSWLFGIVIGVITQRAMRFLNPTIKPPDMTLQVCVTLASAYISFVVAQHKFQISGVLSASAAGLMLAWLAPPIILHHKTMHKVWSYLEWICNTLIFFIAGLVAGNRCALYFQTIDLLYILEIYVVLLVIRAMEIFCMYPILSRGGLRCTVKDAIFMTWAGLRGALGIALALIVERSGVMGSDHNGGKLFIYIAGVAALTLLINAVFAKPLLRYLQLVEVEEESPEKKMILDHIRRSLRKRLTSAVEAEMASDLGQCDWVEVKSLCRLLQDDENAADATQSANIAGTALVADTRLSEYRTNAMASNRDGLNMDILAYIRQAYLSSLKVQYTHAIETGKIGRSSWGAQALLNSVDVAMDHVHDKSVGLHDWNCIVKGMEMPEYMNVVIKFVDGMLGKIGVNKDFHGRMLARIERREVYVLANFMDAHESVQRQMRSFLGGEEGEDFVIPEERQVHQESQAEVNKARDMLSDMNVADTHRFYAQRAARIILMKQAEMIEDMQRRGVLMETDAEKFMQVINDDQTRLDEEREAFNKALIMTRRHREDVLHIKRGSFVLPEITTPVNQYYRESLSLRPSIATTRPVSMMHISRLDLDKRASRPDSSGEVGNVMHDQL